MSSQKVSSDYLMDKFGSAWQDPDVAKRYENAENATRPYAKIIIEKAGLANSSADANILDLATGTGAAVKELYAAVPKEKWGTLKILGADISPPMLEYLKGIGEREGWTGLSTQVIDGNKDIDLPDASYTHIFCSFGIFAMPNVLPSLFKLLKPGGFIGVTTWAVLPWHAMLEASINKMEDKLYCPSEEELLTAMYRGRSWGDKAYVESQLRDAGFTNVDSLRTTALATVGPPATVLESLKFPIEMIVAAWWEESKRAENLKKVSEILLEDVTEHVGGKDGIMKLEFDGSVIWGWKV